MTKKNKEDIEEERGYVIFPDSERCKVSGCAFYEESDVDSNDRCVNVDMAGRIVKVSLSGRGVSASDTRLCPYWGDEIERRDQEKREKRKEGWSSHG